MDDVAPPQVRAVPRWREIFAGRLGLYTGLLNFGILLFGIDTFVVMTLMPTIAADLGDVAYYAWVSMLFVVGGIVGSASFGPLRARLGGRNALALGGAIFTGAALACSLAPSMPVLLLARIVAGWGGGLLLAGSMAFNYSLYEPRLLTRVIAFTSVTYIGSSLLGPFLGGLFADLHWWRGAFWLYVPFGAVFVVWALIFIPKDRTARTGTTRIPFGRLLLLGIGVVSVAAAGRAPAGVLRPALLVAAAALLWAAFALDARARGRIFPSHPLSWARPVGLGYWTLMLVIGTYMSIAIFLPLVLTELYQITPLYVGFVNALMSIAWSISSAIVAGLQGGAERRALAAGPLIVLAGSAGLAAAVWLTAPIALVTLLAILAGFGVGFVNVHMMAKVMAAAEPGEESITASSLSTVRSLGQAFGSAVAGAIANLAGLEDVVTVDAVRAAATGVYLFDTLPAALAFIVVLRFFRVGARTA